MHSAAPKPVLAVYKEIVAGDLRKLLAESNDAVSGGGARDLRFPAKEFGAVMRRIFTTPATGRGGRSILTADVLYRDAQGSAKYTTLEYWPKYASRSEERISKIHKSPALGGQMPRGDRGRIFVVLLQFDDGSVRCTYAYEHDLVDRKKWATELARQILDCMQAADQKNFRRTKSLVTPMGYYEFAHGTGYCHAV